MKYEIKQQADGQTADIHINDFIGDWIDGYFGFGITSKQFIKEFQNLPDAVKTVRLHINSPGGDVNAANHIANTIRDQQTTKGRTVEGLISAAFSAATIITSACKPAKIADNGLMMTHNPWTIALGNAGELRKTAATLDTFRDSIIAAYKWKSPLSEDELIAMMDAETWMDAEDALKNGFVDERIQGVSAAAFIDAKYLEKMPKIPEQYQARVQALIKPRSEAAPAPEPAPEDKNRIEIVDAGQPSAEDVRAIIQECTKAGVADLAEGFLQDHLTVDQVRSRLKDAEAIKTSCALSGVPDRFKGYIKRGMSITEVRAELYELRVHAEAPIDNTVPTERAALNKPKGMTAAEIYELRKKKK